MAVLISQKSLEDRDETAKLSPEHTLWAYNGMDCLVTAEIEEEIGAQLDDYTRHIYKFEMACLAPAMEMALRGIKVDAFAKNDKVRSLELDSSKLDEILFAYGTALGYGKGVGINANSPKQLMRIFYDDLGLPKQYKYDRQKKEERLSVDREALEKLAKFPIANPLVKAILASRDTGKKLSVLRSGVDSDGRMRFSFNVGGTETGRWSSSKNVFGSGMNAQNITEEIRSIFTSSPGHKLAYIDLEQAESRAVAFLSGDTAYRDACNSGDLHTEVTRLIWPRLPWTSDSARNKEIAEQKFYRQFSYRDMAKRGGHGSNYLGTPRTMAIHLKIEEALMRDFQSGYFRAFPGIPTWHGDTATTLQSTGSLTTPFGRRRAFLGRLGESSTLREAVAYCPQSLIADYMNAGVCRLWSWGQVSLLAQVHDAVLFEYPEGRDDLVLEAAKILSHSINLLDGSTFSIPCEASIGWNWGKYKKDLNPYGIKKLKNSDDRTPPPSASSPSEILARRFH